MPLNEVGTHGALARGEVSPANYMVFVSLLYDVLILIGFQIGLILFGATKGFNIYNWVGVIIICIGFVIFKMGELYNN